MSKFDRILSDDDANSIIKNTTILLGQSISRSKDLILKVEQAVLEKLSEQEPSAPDGFRLVNEEDLIELSDSILGNYYRGQDWERGRITNILKAAPCVSPTSDKAACVSEIAESETQTNSQGFLDGSNHIIDASKMVDDADEALRKELDLVGLDMGAYSSPKEAVAALIDWHVSIAIDPRINGGWRLVPDQLNNEMAQALRLGSRKDYPSDLLCEVRYTALLAAAPKYTGDK